MRVAFFVERDMCHPTHRRYAFVSTIIRHFENCAVFISNGNHVEISKRIVGQQADFDGVLTFLYGDSLLESCDVLQDLDIPLIVIEHDAYQNYIVEQDGFGLFSTFLSRCPVDLFVVSGLTTIRRFRREGQRCLYLPKAAPEAFLEFPNRESGFFCAFGSHRHIVYQHRAKLLRHVAPQRWFDPLGRVLPVLTANIRQSADAISGNMTVHRLKFRFSQMAELLSLYSACVICDTGLNEPMAKHFEVSALGLVPFRDGECSDELAELGYRNGQSMVVYDDCEDLIEKIRYFSRNAGELTRMQQHARRAAVGNTWEIRARELYRVLEADY